MKCGQAEEILDGHAVLSAEGASTVRSDDTNPLDLYSQGVCDLGSISKRGLGGDDDLQVPVLVKESRSSFCLEIGMLLVGDLKAGLYHGVTFGKGSFSHACFQGSAE